jgi:type VI secretion system secreted protein VgrG
MPTLKTTKSIKFAGAIAALTVASFTFTTSAMAVQPTVGLGNAKSFAVLAGSGITNTGATTVSGTAGGNLGSSPTGTFTGDTLVTTTGTKYTAVDSVVDAAKDSLVTAYNDAAGRTPFNSVSADLGGQTLTQGVYNSASSLGLTGTLTLDAEGDPNAVFIFQAGSTLTTASNSVVRMINGAQSCNVFWQVGSSATFGTSSDFIGHVLALTSITANTTATFHGSLLARNGAVTLDTNTIVNDACSSVPPTEEGGTLPNTDTVDWLIPVSIGAGLVALGAVVYIFRRKRS